MNKMLIKKSIVINTTLFNKLFISFSNYKIVKSPIPKTYKTHKINVIIPIIIRLFIKILKTSTPLK